MEKEDIFESVKPEDAAKERIDQEVGLKSHSPDAGDQELDTWTDKTTWAHRVEVREKLFDQSIIKLPRALSAPIAELVMLFPVCLSVENEYLLLLDMWRANY